ncbi:MAG TPA: CoB--CoM heterodisulfide reductase iron-sulfur subunit A family protein, partial [Anaerolineae bacterium]|nr:CoB--CoM heterodisulfide reductase iron-sulfur subunit A family protein [Anaerolineae bacterium]
ISAGVAKARHLEALEPIRLAARQQALVIGGGVAGLRAAWDIARRGLKVTLIEKTPFLGGHMAQLETMFPTDQNARAALHELIEKVLAHPNITVYTQAELIGLKGYVGDFHVEIRQQSRGVSPEGGSAETAIKACPIAVPDEFNYGLTSRKAIYRAYPGCYPATAAIDWEQCTLCGACQAIDGRGIDLVNKPQTFEINVGAIVAATGFKLYEPQHGEFGYGELPEVITLAQLIRLMALTPDHQPLKWHDRPVRSLAMIHCVGSRQVEGIHEPQPDGQVNSYCSRMCCTATLHAANDLRQRFPNVNVFDIYQDIRTYGRGHEAYYERAGKNLVRFLRYHVDESPQIERAPQGDAYPVLVKVKDYLTQGEEIEVPVDLVVLATGMMPNPIDDLIKLLKVAPGTDRFLLEVHPKLRPVETAVPGIVLAGTAQSPMNIQESVTAAEAAAAKVSVLLSQGSVQLEPYVARVDVDRCTGSGQCVEVCHYEGAIALQTMTIDGQEVQRAVVSPANCVGCGMCVSACLNRAIDVQGWTLDQYEVMVDAIADDRLVLEVLA